MIDTQRLSTAHRLIKPFIHRTPVLTSTSVNHLTGNTIFFKCENFQRTGSFKFRGACNAVAACAEQLQNRGVITHSSGNHAQALALAAKLHDIPVFVVMPQTAARVKQKAAESYGATVVLCQPTYISRQETVARLQQESGAVFISSADNEDIIAGQGTAAIELIDEVGSLDLILTPVGGGGLLAGTALAASDLLPHVKVIGCEPEQVDDAYHSFNSGTRITEVRGNTIAEGLMPPLGVHPFAIIRKFVDDIVLVTEREILHAMHYIWERMKIIIEPSSAVAVAPLLNRRLKISGKRIGVILSGGNVDLDRFFAMLTCSL
ncbi:threonine/serine dehydratase [Candidatus Acetothermia bacterium]|jgi:threonine dehydratase|nr:threonine/serine dehydratase [Candidatus Acetothermia bacterium]MCI2426003.1 threonine/serine dehydratase [Candidatus Acetothermia bacterium]MCI2427131.1 threonine/serine dehydratase [Candidatus Acetothermia bacterium]MCI2428965.1 threonine/serine dehydratase [Candidatus Acetothermia bacterium]